MNQAEFEQANKDKGRGATLEDWIQTSTEVIVENNNPDAVPDGGEWLDSNGQGMGIVQLSQIMRASYRNYCEWEELKLPNGQTGIYVRAHAPNADRFL